MGSRSADLAALRTASARCRGCELWEPATQVVFSSGAPDTKVMLVGEQLGDVEDQDGEPFVGPAGRLLHRAMDEAGIVEEGAHLTNAVKHFRFVQRGKRRIHEKPDLAHLVACKPWLDAEVAEVDPTVDRRARCDRRALDPRPRDQGHQTTRRDPDSRNTEGRPAVHGDRASLVDSPGPRRPRSRLSGPRRGPEGCCSGGSGLRTAYGISRCDHDFRGKCRTRRPG